MPLQEIIHIAQEVGRRSMIEGRQFRDALIEGPAVLVPLEKVTFHDCTFNADPDSLFIEIPEGRNVVGLIGLRDTSFTNCEFRNVALAGAPETVAKLRDDIGRITQD